MIRIRKAHDRGHADFGWLKTFHTFSFGNYYDPQHTGFRSLRVMNEDRVLPGKGFPTHPHRDMEIVSYVLAGRLGHRDSLGNGSVIQAGELQRMTAGTGVQHSEQNVSQSEAVHFYQIWIVPSHKNLPPGYEQRSFPKEDRSDRFQLVASPQGEGDSVKLHQDVRISLADVGAGVSISYDLQPGRFAWVQALSGALGVNGEALESGDGARISEEQQLTLEASVDSECMLFDLG